MLQDKDKEYRPEEINGRETFFIRFVKGVERLKSLVSNTLRYTILIVGILLAILLFIIFL